ncbi:MAG: ABC transporter ATP-binding protein [Chloroflexi bacterium]|nr:ABC transporter ATP-binding protein [Chloroflexota bacterium]
MVPINAQNVTLAYNGRAVLENVSLEVREGQILALVGVNGAGKTTLLRALARLLTPRSGTVLIHGRDAARLSAREAARQIGLTPQQSGAMWPLTVEEVVALGRAAHRGWLLPLTARDRAVIERVLEQTDLLALRERAITTLSGGEKQRALIARALVQEPAILLLDEPTANLDLRYQDMILALAQRLAMEQGLAVVVSIHDLNLAARYAQRVALLAEKQVLAIGSPDEVFTEETLTRAYGAPIVVTRHPLYDAPLITPAARG